MCRRAREYSSMGPRLRKANGGAMALEPYAVERYVIDQGRRILAAPI